MGRSVDRWIRAPREASSSERRHVQSSSLKVLVLEASVKGISRSVFATDVQAPSSLSKHLTRITPWSFGTFYMSRMCHAHRLKYVLDKRR